MDNHFYLVYIRHVVATTACCHIRHRKCVVKKDERNRFSADSIKGYAMSLVSRAILKYPWRMSELFVFFLMKREKQKEEAWDIISIQFEGAFDNFAVSIHALQVWCSVNQFTYGAWTSSIDIFFYILTFGKGRLLNTMRDSDVRSSLSLEIDFQDVLNIIPLSFCFRIPFSYFAAFFI